MIFSKSDYLGIISPPCYAAGAAAHRRHRRASPADWDLLDFGQNFVAKLPPQVAPFSDLEVVEAAAEAVAYRSDFGQGYRNRNNLIDRTKWQL